MGEPQMDILKPIKPMLLTPSTEIPDTDDWLFQLKLDGFRTLLSFDRKAGFRIFTRHQLDITRQFPEFHVELPFDSLLLDGETVVIEQGKPVLEKAVSRIRANPSRFQHHPAQFVAFDLLYMNGQSLLHLPLIERLRLLEGLGLSAPLSVCPSYPDGRQLFEATKRLGLEGICAKRKQSRYTLDKRVPYWLKLKHYVFIQAEVIGVRFNPFRVLTRLENGQWNAIQFMPAHVRKGIIQKLDFAKPTDLNLAPLKQPQLCKLQYMGLTQNGQLREASIKELLA